MDKFNDIDHYDDFDEVVEQAIKDDEIDALLESAFSDLEDDTDFDDDELDSATEGYNDNDSIASVSSMISKGISKKDAIKYMQNLVDYFTKHDMLSISIDSVDEHTAIRYKNLTMDGVNFVKKFNKKIGNIENDAGNMQKLNSALKDYASNQCIADKVCSYICSVIGCGIFAIPLIIMSQKYKVFEKRYNRIYKADKDTAIEGVSLEDDTDFDDDELDSATESSMFLDIIMESCDSMEEFQDLVNESAYEWEMYGLIDDAKSALEATKIMKVENWKEKNRKRLINRECIRVSMKKDDPLYKKYKKFRDAMREFREKIFTKYEAIATRNVRQAQQNSKHKAANMHTAGGRDVNARINKAMARSESGHNPTNAPKKSNAS